MLYDYFDYAGVFHLNRGSQVPVDITSKYVLRVMASTWRGRRQPKLTCYHGSPCICQLQERIM